MKGLQGYVMPPQVRVVWFPNGDYEVQCLKRRWYGSTAWITYKVFYTSEDAATAYASKLYDALSGRSVIAEFGKPEQEGEQ